MRCASMLLLTILCVTYIARQNKFSEILRASLTLVGVINIAKVSCQFTVSIIFISICAMTVSRWTRSGGRWKRFFFFRQRTTPSAATLWRFWESCAAVYKWSYFLSCLLIKHDVVARSVDPGL